MGKKQSLNKIYAKYINGDDYLISNETNTPAQDLLSERDIQLLTQNITILLPHSTSEVSWCVKLTLDVSIWI